LGVVDRTIFVDGVEVPRFFYGTAWKEEATERLTQLALAQGFRGIDTANQRRHYDEASVGRAILAAVASGLVTRDELFLQTKFTFRRGQDHRLPYDPAAPVAVQVEQSLASSLAHFATEPIDSFVLHGPSVRTGLGADDWAAWRAMERMHDNGRVRLLGVSNVSLGQLQLLLREARVRPRFVQNRCYASLAWDRAIREFCGAHDIVYQGFSLLTANGEALVHPEMAEIVSRVGRSASQIVFRFALKVGMIPLTGTSDPQHMREDLEVFEFSLEPADVRRIENLLVG
jgi:diketogulonate reductase-like aldo/keto reductase